MLERVEVQAGHERTQAGGAAPGVPRERTLPDAHRLRRPDDLSTRSDRPPAACGGDEAGAKAPELKTAAPQRARFRVDASLPSVRWLTSVVGAVLRNAAWPEEVRGDVTLAVDEALQNAVEHGSAPAVHLDVELVLSGDCAEITVRDRGLPETAPPAAFPSPPHRTAVRGRGRLIIVSLADEAEWRPSGDGTEVRLRFGRDGGR